MSRLMQVVPVVLLLVILGILLSQMAEVITAQPPQTRPVHATSPLCRSGAPLAGVYNPWRLRVVDSCITVTGHIVRVARMADGDYHIDVKLDAPFAGLVNRRNVSKQGGSLVTEIVPVDQTGIATPHVGDHIEVTGVYVLDKLHGWMEIHPVWGLKVI